MLINPTLDKLHALSLSGMAHALLDQLERTGYASSPFVARHGLANKTGR